MQPAEEFGIDLLKRQMTFLFNRACYNFMNGRNCRDRCTYNHFLPAPQEIFQKLMMFSVDTITNMYLYFIVKNPMSFVTYFPTICEVFGSKKMQSSLLAAVKHCEKHKKITFYVHIYNALVKMELSKQEALSTIVDCCCQSEAAYTSIVNIMIEADPLYFIEMLKKYYRRAKIQTHSMVLLTEQVNDNPAPSLLKLFIDVFDKYSLTDLCDVGTYKLLLSRARILAIGDHSLIKKLNHIALRNN